MSLIQILSNTIIRITSYNVCYTKLLRRKAGSATVTIDEIQSDQTYLDRKLIEKNLSCKLG